MDFDDLLVNTVRLLRDHPDVLEHYRAALRAHPRRRVPGHQPGPERDRPAARRRPPQRHGRRRHRPVGVPLPGRRLPQHHAVRGRLPRRHDGRARPELPQHADDPRRRQRGDRQQRRRASRRTCGPTPAPAHRIVRYHAEDEGDEATFVASTARQLHDDHATTGARSPCCTARTPRAASSRRR